MKSLDKKAHARDAAAFVESGEMVSTEKMLSKLKAVREIETFIEENGQGFYNSTIREHFDALLEKYKISKADAIERSGIERGYAYQILRGAKEAKRDKYIRLAIGMGLDLEDTQQLLTIARHGILYSRILRDAVIIFGINNHFDIIKLQMLLEEQHAEPLE
ncbi:MAG: hypothetical protein BWY11_01504 [Firmicutes bacterium ADurb.Bin182]|nr:MAG: hypothetical protein BWY11_01504 [Firmicutes bacterium ADurb.Bin182]